MSAFFDETPVRIPVKLVDGAWEYLYGGGLPLKNHTFATLVVGKSWIEDKQFLALLKRKTEYRVLDEGTELLVALTVRDQSALSAQLTKHLIRPSQMKLGGDYYSTPRPNDTRLVKIWIGPPTRKQAAARKQDQGGVWLQFEGAECKGISISSVLVPDAIAQEPLDSLNYAFTRLSEVFEPWRQSHTGSIYTRMLYQERNGKWYPLEVLRNATTAKDEHQLIKTHWAHIEAQLFPVIPTP